MLKVCLDSNVLVSGLVYGRKPGKIVDMALLGKSWRLVTSDFILDEVERNAVKCGLNRWTVRFLRRRLTEVADVTKPKGHLKFDSLQSGDGMVVETAWLGKARYLVTGDRELLGLGHYKYTRVIEPKHFLVLLEQR